TRSKRDWSSDVCSSDLEGHDVVIGYFEPHGRQDTIAKTEGLEILTRRRVEYRGREFEEMATPAILARQPKICAVDEFAHTNVPRSEERRVGKDGRTRWA